MYCMVKLTDSSLAHSSWRNDWQCNPCGVFGTWTAGPVWRCTSGNAGMNALLWGSTPTSVDTWISNFLVTGLAMRGPQKWPLWSPDFISPWLTCVGVHEWSCLWMQSGHTWGLHLSHCQSGLTHQWLRHSSLCYMFCCELGKDMCLSRRQANICWKSGRPGYTKSCTTIKCHYLLQ
jgi:hypothetical protein